MKQHSFIHPFNSGAEYLTDERCYINEYLNEGADGMSIARARVEPGITTAWHRLHGVTERYVILEGRGRMEIGDEPAFDVYAGDTVVIPPGTRQRIANIGPDELVFLCLCTPGFTPECYEPLE
ncbi:MAG: cupin domain-containing protein [candidate division Zixibacteria bacterium]|jgi:mannose-6-phosphate isomerase-like protein (cupin superfamily)|nr:cupin domain-containing protein [candidate division Zixibacteria bacterium]